MDPEYRGVEQGPIRPPSEAHSLLIRVSRNCPWNRCRFCGVYKGARFSRRPLEHVLRDIDAIADFVEATPGRPIPRGPPSTARGPGMRVVGNWYSAGMRSIFLQDADPLVVPPAELVTILAKLRDCFPHTERITTYARSRSLARVSVEELRAMRAAGLDRIHVGFETGSDQILALMDKGVTKAVHRRRDAR